MADLSRPCRWSILLLILVLSRKECTALSLSSRRHILQTAAAVSASAASGLLGGPLVASADTVTDDPSRLLLANGVSIPRVGYSLYKTAPEQVAEGVQLALAAGVRHFDCASQYGTNAMVGKTLQTYVQKGLVVDTDTRPTIAATILSTKQGRRQELFVTHKLSNAEQSTDTAVVKRNVSQQCRLLGHVDLALIHSPLTDKARRLATYRALLELQYAGTVRAVGVCHFGVPPLQELVDAGLPAPAVIQLVLSPFQQHSDILQWAAVHGSAVECAAWSKLSSVEGPAEGWAALGKIADACKVTKQQVLIRWAIQRGFVCVPRSSSKYKVEQQAIAENAWPAVSAFVLSERDMKTLNGLDKDLPAGQLRVLDGWNASDIMDDNWDPTRAIV